ncbi:DNA cytosine methyltransferase [Paracoccus sp. (in: a-proteobacteria)]|uniref:DNA cytosine methyltransferase n=1 Tax=Paracoccus sp. TaxID=267 RepID=UPI00289FC72D|nr:DNA cytosine methyltransferase [Paracoccus sp. (in: a-proteobacteria)]
MMRYLSVCSGIEAATQAWAPLGWEPVAFSEIEPFPSAVLAHHYPTVPNWGDMTKFEEWPDEPIDLLCGGTPCQDYSVAGLRLGMDGARGQLTLTFVEIAARYRPSWLVWENVPGVLSSNDGRDFARFLGDLTGQEIDAPPGGWKNSGIIPGIGDAYGIAYRVLDAQHVRTRRFPFAVPQRRRRVWVVGYLGDWRRTAAVLFDRESLSGHPAPSRKSGQGFTRGIEFGPQGGGFADVSPTLDTRAKDGPIRNQLAPAALVANSGDVGYCLTASAQQSLDAETETETLLAVQPVAIQERAICENPNAGPDRAGFRQDGAAYTLEARTVPQAVAFDCKGAEAHFQTDGAHQSLRGIGHGGGHAAVAFDLRGREGGAMPEGPHETANLRAASGGSSRSYVAQPWAVRRLMPTECERLQGFPDGFTAIPWRNKPADQCPNGPRYKALGNSWAVNCAEWIGERIAMVEELTV